ncbi:hypothetical protein LTR66_009878 [Elasticomyces elasticus]|nr:hypothetical protein LTR66_009878 [Elasticomyces elasticus]
MVWSQIEAIPSHLTYLLLSTFLLAYTLFSTFIRNRLHLSEPPIALLAGVIAGPQCLNLLTPETWSVEGRGGRNNDGWGWGDNIVQEVTRVIVGIQVFAVAVELPAHYMSRHWRSIGMMLGPVMTFGWLVCALFVYILFQADVATSLTIAACLTPTDPVLAASILSNSKFSTRVPKRLKDMLSAESGCNDGIAFPFLFLGLSILTKSTAAAAAKEWFLITLLWQCVFGLTIGLCIGTAFNRLLRFSDGRGYIDAPGLTVFYLLLAILGVGVGSTLGADDFLVSFGAGYGFARDGWFAKKTHGVHLPNVVDLLLNSSMFVYLGTIIPWYAFSPTAATPYVTPVRLLAFLALVLCFRRIPVVLALHRWIPDILTVREALFAGHFGPMGLGGLFLAIEARAQLETDTSAPLPHPPKFHAPYTNRQQAIETIWPVVCFVVMGSTVVHGFSVLALSLGSHFRRKEGERAPLLAGETDPLHGMVHDGGGESEVESEEE